MPANDLTIVHLSEFHLQAADKQPTGKDRRRKKRELKSQKKEPLRRGMNEQIQAALESGKRLEIDCARVVKGDDYVTPPHVKGYICLDGQTVAEQISRVESDGVADVSDADVSVESEEIKL